MAKIKYLMLHCTATPAGAYKDKEDVRKWHMSPPPQGRGWSRPGYRKLILLDGMVQELWPYNDDDIIEPWEITNGARSMNAYTVHYAYVGGVSADNPRVAQDTRTPNQRISMEREVREFIARHPDAKVVGHNQFAAKACPSFDVPEWLRSIGIPRKNIYMPRK